MSSSCNDILIKNIIECSADIERCSAEIDLLVFESLLNKDFSTCTVADIKSDVLQCYEEIKNLTVPSKYESARQKVYICTKIAENVKIASHSDKLLDCNSHAVKISYWNSNRYAQEAFVRFSKLFNKFEEIHVESFNAVCESISDEYTLGIVPIVNSTDGKLTAFYRLIDKFDLKILSTCNVENLNSDGFTRLALVGKKILSFKNESTKRIELLITENISDFVMVTELMGGSVKEITSIPSPYNKNEALNYISINLSVNKIHIAWWYWYIFGGDIDLLGLYTEI